MSKRSRTVAAVLPGALACGLALSSGRDTAAAAAPPAPRLEAATSGPALAVTISIDGLSWERLDRYRPWFVAGLKRLLDESTVYTNARYRHLNTETGPGHAALSTGAPPRVTGIMANRWFETNPDGSIRGLNCVDQRAPERVPGNPPMFYRSVERDGRLYVFADAESLELFLASGETGRGTIRPGYGPAGETVVFDGDDAIVLYNLYNGRPKETFFSNATIPGPANLRVPTIADRLVEARAGARLVSLSAKDRSAIFLAGRDPRHSVYWWDQRAGRFVTSAAYRPPTAARRVVDRVNLQLGPLLPRRFGLAWAKLAPAEPSGRPAPVRPLPEADLGDYQLPSAGLGWDHSLAVHPQGYFASLYYTPFIDELLADLAVAFVEDESFNLGRGKQPDLFALSFSAQDTVSHSYGAESEENLDTLRRLDLQLGRVLDAIERAHPRGGVVIALSADHGFPPIPEAERRRNPAFPGGGRLVSGPRSHPDFLQRLNRALATELCLAWPESRVLFGSDGWNVIYNRPAFPMRTLEGPCGEAGRKVEMADVDRVLPRVVSLVLGDEVEKLYLVSQRASWPQDDPVTEFVRNDFDPERSGDVFLIPRYGVMTHWDPGRGAMHGSHFDYDTHVPLMFWGGPFRAATRDGAATPYDLAPTLAKLLGVPLPDATGTPRVP